MPNERRTLVAGVVATVIATSIACGSAQTPALKGIDAGWVLLVRPEGRLYLDNATADWTDYLESVARHVTQETRYSNSAECMADGRRLFERRLMVPGSQANEKLGGQSIQCVRGCRVDPGPIIMVCDEVTSPEIYR